MTNTCKRLMLIPALAASSVFAVVSVQNIDPAAGGIGYRWTVSMDNNGTTGSALLRHVGDWSWDEDTFPQTARGWTHTSDWIALNLLDSAQVSLTLSAQAGVPNPDPNAIDPFFGSDLFPGFTIYAGWDNDGTDDHTYNNQGNIAWAEDVLYLDHASTTTVNTLTKSWSLPAGLYSIVVGGNFPADEARGRQGYLAQITTTPAIVPEPAHAGVLACLLASAIANRRRSNASCPK